MNLSAGARPESGNRKAPPRLIRRGGVAGSLQSPFRNRNILILSDHDPGRICGHTIHVQYLHDFLGRWNRVRLDGHARLRDLRTADVVWIRSEKLFLQWVLVCAMTRRITVYDLASFPWLELQMAGRSRARIALSRWTFQLALKTAVVRVLSASMSDYLKAVFRIPDDRMFVLPIPVRLPAIRRKSRTVGRLHFVYMGSEKPWQGFRNLIDAFARLESDPVFRLHCYGIRGRDTKNVRFHKSVSHPEMIRILTENADAVVVPRPRNAVTEHVTPIKFAEAAALGLPILATDLKVLRELGGGRVRLLPDNETETLIRGIRSFRKERKTR